MENIIGYHCAPALAGIKPSNLVACYKNQGYNVASEIKRLNEELNCKDIYFEPVCECEKRVLLLCYRKKILGRVLNQPEIKEFLSVFGYSEADNPDTYIAILKRRFVKGKFPHEIGIFLGYPLHDVYGFIFHKDEGCLLCGEWKVYKNPEEAQKLFDRFSACRKAVLRRVLQGFTLAQMFCAT